MSKAGDIAATGGIRPASWAQRQAKRLLLRLGAHVEHGKVTIRDGQERYVFGAVTTACPLQAEIRILDPSFYVDSLMGGSIGWAESFMRWEWETDDLPTLLRIVVYNASLYDGLDRRFGAILRPIQNLAHAFRKNSETGSRRNIMAHYDLGNDFFSLFLDKTMAYSCAYFPRPDCSLEEASRAKFDRLCRKLDLKPDDHLLEIGTGWGGLALHAAKEYGCRVTTTTISKEQRAWSQAKVREAGLEERVVVLGADYRKLTGTYDKLVSVEMIEAVGHHYLDLFFRCCGRLLKPDGLMALQAITVPNRWFRAHRTRATFINTHIFPGSCLPSDEAMTRAIARGTDLDLVHKEDISAHYARTLAIWRDNFHANLDHIRKVWPDKAFSKAWELYFSCCEAGFAERDIGVAQYLFAKPKARPLLSFQG
jgi:cyclopropane-fatty-acyl-phospholipid synthase